MAVPCKSDLGQLFYQGICSALKSAEIVDDNKTVSLWEQAAQGEGWPRSQPALGMESEPRGPALGRSRSFQPHKGGRVSMKSTLSTAHPA